jgi:hypothetical protein
MSEIEIRIPKNAQATLSRIQSGMYRKPVIYIGGHTIYFQNAQQIDEICERFKQIAKQLRKGCTTGV